MKRLLWGGIVGGIVGIMGHTRAQEVGFGTTAPGARLDIQIPSGYHSPLLRLGKDSAVYWVISANGYVGVGVDSPLHRFHIGGRDGSIGLLLSDTNAGAHQGIDIENYAEMDLVAYRDADSVPPDVRLFGFYRGAARVPLWIVLGDGRMGIGTDTPRARLDVWGDLRLRGGGRSIKGAADHRLNIYHHTDAHTSRSWIELWGWDAARSGELSLTGNYVDFRYGSDLTGVGSIGMRLDSFGKWGIGTLHPVARLHVANDGMVYAQGSFGTGDTIPGGPHVAFIWNPRQAAIRAGTAQPGRWSGGNAGDYSVAFGYNGKAQRGFSGVGGGRWNEAWGASSFVGGGDSNRAQADLSFVGGGFHNTAEGQASFVGGGANNTVRGTESVIGGGRDNSTDIAYAFETIGGGQNNVAKREGSVVPGGQLNRAEGECSWAGGKARFVDWGSSWNTGVGTFAWGHASVNTSGVTLKRSFIVGGDGNSRSLSYRVRINEPAVGFALSLPNDSAVDVGQGRAYGWYTYSDRRVKSRIQPITGAVSLLEKLHPVRYIHHNSRFTPDGKLVVDSSGKPAYGFIAQELATVVPEAVDIAKVDGDSLWVVNYEALIPILTAVIQEQQRRIDRLQGKIADAGMVDPADELSRLQRQTQHIEQRLRALETAVPSSPSNVER